MEIGKHNVHIGQYVVVITNSVRVALLKTERIHTGTKVRLKVFLPRTVSCETLSNYRRRTPEREYAQRRELGNGRDIARELILCSWRDDGIVIAETALVTFHGLNDGAAVIDVGPIENIT